MSGTNGSATASPRAVVLAGGVGTRLPPHSTEFPKPLVPLGGEQAVIEVVLRQLRRQGFARITLAIGNLGGLVRAYCEDGSRWGIDLDYWTEDVPLGTIVVHGHTPVSEPEFRPHRINIDTGAYVTGRLTCLKIDAEGPFVLFTTGMLSNSASD